MRKDIFGIPPLVRAGINTRAEDYIAAREIGASCVADLIASFQADPFLVGTNRLGAIARLLATSDIDHGVEVGFFSEIDRLILKGARYEALEVQTRDLLAEVTENATE